MREDLRLPRMRDAAAESLGSGQWTSALWFYDRLVKAKAEAGDYAGRALAHANLNHRPDSTPNETLNSTEFA
jgi:hypothetical protein